MNKLVLIPVLLAATACQQDTKNLERKLDLIIAKLDTVGKNAPAAGNPGAQRAPRPQPDAAKTYSVPVAGNNFDGPADAKVTLVKAYDYACPYCEKVRPTMEELHKKYGNDLRIAYKQLVVHPRNAMASALAFCAAGKQGKHKEMDQLLWDKGFKARNMDLSDVAADPQAEKGAEKAAGGKCWDSPDGCKIVNGFAQELQLDVNKFKADMKGECQQVVQSDMKTLSGLGVNGTPGFFVNGRFIGGAVPVENFIQVIDEEMKKANERVQQGTPAANYYQQWVVDKGQKTLGG
jgi:protein-disulfide isomerase